MPRHAVDGAARERRRAPDVEAADGRPVGRKRRHGPQQDLVELVWSQQPATTPAPTSYDEVPSSSPESVALSKALRSHGFTFVGPTTMYALMEAVGIVDTHLVGSHRRGSSGVWTG